MSTAEFSNQDIYRARDAQDAHNRTILGAGLRWAFDRTPDEMKEFLSARRTSPENPPRFPSAAWHAENLDLLTEQVGDFDQLITDLTTFIDRPITRRNPRADESPEELRIREADLRPYTQLHNSVARYTEALSEHGPTSHAVALAARATARIVHPHAWREAGYPIPESQQPLDTRPVSRYLGALILAHPLRAEN